MNIIVLSRNPALYSTQRLVMTAEKRGHKVEVIDHMKCKLVIEKNHPQIFYGRRTLKDIDAIIPRIGSSVTFYGTAVVRQFEMMSVFTTTSSEPLIRAKDKLKSLQYLSRAGLGVPKTVFTNYTEEVDQLIDAVGDAPLVVKLLEGTQGLGVILAENRSAAASVIEAFHKVRTRVMVQEYIKESKGADIRVFVVDGEIVASMKRQAKKGEFRSNFHRGGTTEKVQLTPAQEAAALKAARVMGLAIAGVDILDSRRGPLILEVNASPGLEGIEGATDVDIAGKIIDYVEKYAHE